MMKNGVYQIRHLESGKRYIGSCASKGGLWKRWIIHKHRLRKGNHHSIHLQRAWNKYGADAFVFEILLYCDPNDCLVYEQMAFDCYDPKYNICKIAGNSLGRKVSSLTRQKLSDAHSGKKNHLYGKTRSFETCRKISVGVRGVKNGGAKLSERQIDVIRRALKVGIKGRKLADRFSVSASTISEIKHDKRWKV